MSIADEIRESMESMPIDMLLEYATTMTDILCREVESAERMAELSQSLMHAAEASAAIARHDRERWLQQSHRFACAIPALVQIHLQDHEN